jgi:AraC family transcriptional regulator of adaptative response/methylated-DNA-[protein]-cysteine methyltransferase
MSRVQRACARLARADGHLSLTALAAQVGGSPYHLQRTFKRLVGVTPRQYADACRLDRLKRGLRAGSLVTTAVVDAGYGSSSRFYERTAPKLGMTPAVYGRGGAGMDVKYTIVDSPLGRLLVAATRHGVCAVAMGSSDHALRLGLADEYPAARIASGGTALRAWTARILAHLSGRRPHLDLPLDIQATAFQWQVWSALSHIPRGETRSYSQVASAIGRPAATRAVARACARNPVALAIPCHRVVPSVGGVGGYRWGAERKRALLERERSQG